MLPSPLEKFELDAKSRHTELRFSFSKSITVLFSTQTPDLFPSTTPTSPDRSPGDRALLYLIISRPGRWRASPQHHRGWELGLHWDGCESRSVQKNFCEWLL